MNEKDISNMQMRGLRRVCKCEDRGGGYANGECSPLTRCPLLHAATSYTLSTLTHRPSYTPSSLTHRLLLTRTH